jgi:hypothetical protein
VWLVALRVEKDRKREKTAKEIKQTTLNSVFPDRGHSLKLFVWLTKVQEDCSRLSHGMILYKKIFFFCEDDGYRKKQELLLPPASWVLLKCSHISLLKFQSGTMNGVVTKI